jgi:hypothetical protein
MRIRNTVPILTSCPTSNYPGAASIGWHTHTHSESYTDNLGVFLERLALISVTEKIATRTLTTNAADGFCFSSRVFFANTCIIEVPDLH